MAEANSDSESASKSARLETMGDLKARPRHLRQVKPRPIPISRPIVGSLKHLMAGQPRSRSFDEKG